MVVVMTRNQLIILACPTANIITRVKIIIIEQEIKLSTAVYSYIRADNEGTTVNVSKTSKQKSE
jgi:hypothetical protein